MGDEGIWHPRVLGQKIFNRLMGAPLSYVIPFCSWTADTLLLTYLRRGGGRQQQLISCSVQNNGSQEIVKEGHYKLPVEPLEETIVYDETSVSLDQILS